MATTEGVWTVTPLSKMFGRSRFLDDRDSSRRSYPCNKTCYNLGSELDTWTTCMYFPASTWILPSEELQFSMGHHRSHIQTVSIGCVHPNHGKYPPFSLILNCNNGNVNEQMLIIIDDHNLKMIYTLWMILPYPFPYKHKLLLDHVEKLDGLKTKHYRHLS